MACSAGAGGTGSGGTSGGTPLTPEQLMAYAGPAPKNLNVLEGVWLASASRLAAPKIRMEIRGELLTIAFNCNGKTLGSATQVQIGTPTSSVLSDGGTERGSSYTVLGGVDLKVDPVGTAKGCMLKVKEGKVPVFFHSYGAGFSDSGGVSFDEGLGTFIVPGFTKIGD